MSTMADCTGLANDIASKIDTVIAKTQTSAPLATQGDIDNLAATLKVVDDKVNGVLNPPAPAA